MMTRSLESSTCWTAFFWSLFSQSPPKHMRFVAQRPASTAPFPRKPDQTLLFFEYLGRSRHATSVESSDDDPRR